MVELLLVSALLVWQDPAAGETESVWARLAREHVDDYQLVSTSNPDARFERIEAPVSQHVQNVRGNATGSVYVWHDESGRPVAICDVFFLPRSGQTYALFDEWHSLTSDSMSAVRAGALRWSPAEPGLEWQPIPDAGDPAETSARRRLQLRQLSRRFSAHIVLRNDERYELRMLPTPIFRYDTSVNDESLGGGLFAFCQGNDPETLLIIEARRHDDGYRWEYAAAELSNLSQFLHLDEKVVWAADPPRFSRTGPHMGGSIRNVEIPVE